MDAQSLSSENASSDERLRAFVQPDISDLHAAILALPPEDRLAAVQLAGDGVKALRDLLVADALDAKLPVTDVPTLEVQRSARPIRAARDARRAAARTHQPVRAVLHGWTVEFPAG